MLWKLATLLRFSLSSKLRSNLMCRRVETTAGQPRVDSGFRAQPDMIN
jgi:hypothetical protein